MRGVQIHVTERKTFEPVSVGIAAVKVVHDLYPELFLWKEPPYEYVFDQQPFDIIAGTGALRGALERGDSLEMIVSSWKQNQGSFVAARDKYLLY